MTRFIVAFSLALIALTASASPLTLSFNAVPLIQFAQATYKDMLGVDYVISPEIVGTDKRITVNVKNIDSSRLPAFMADILLQQGISVSQRDGIIYLEPVQVVVPSSSPAQNQPGQNGGGVSLSGLDLMSTAPVLPHSATVWDSSKHAMVPLDSLRGSSAADLVEIERDSKVFFPKNRPAEFIVEALNAGFGAKSAQLVGDRVLVTVTPTQMKKIDAIFPELDYDSPSVEISASWIEVTHTTGNGLGISMTASFLGARFGASLGTTNSGSALSLTGTNFQLVLDALSTDNHFKQVSNSRMVGDDGTKVSLNVGDETPTIGSTTANTAGNPTQNIVYRPSGIIVDVTPRVLGNGRISIAVDGQISSFQNTTTGVAGSPTLIKREVKSNVTIDDGEVLLIGGLNDTQSTNNKSGWSFLPASWSAHNDNGVQTDLVLMLSAKVTKKKA